MITAAAELYTSARVIITKGKKKTARTRPAPIWKMSCVPLYFCTAYFPPHRPPPKYCERNNNTNSKISARGSRAIKLFFFFYSCRVRLRRKPPSMFILLSKACTASDLCVLPAFLSRVFHSLLLLGFFFFFFWCGYLLYHALHIHAQRFHFTFYIQTIICAHDGILLFILVLLIFFHSEHNGWKITRDRVSLYVRTAVFVINLTNVFV